MLKEDKGDGKKLQWNESGDWIITGNTINICFIFELVQVRDRRVPLARHNLSERFEHTETEEQQLHRLEELKRNTSLMTQTETGDKQMENLKNQRHVLL